MCDDDLPRLPPIRVAPEEAVDLALAALEAAGVDPRNVILGVAEPADDAEGNRHYATHVGACDERDDATMLEFVVMDLRREVNHQCMALFGPERCPECDSVRYGHRQGPDPSNSIRVMLWMECMACGYTGPFDDSK